MPKEFLQGRINDFLAGVKTIPKPSDIILCCVILSIYSVIALVIGFSTKFFSFDIIQGKPIFLCILPFSMFVFPSLLEELFFRGLLLPHKKRNMPIQKIWLYSMISVVLFVLWHPVNAFTINKAAITIFTDPIFLFITTLLAVTCTVTYLKSGCIWIPVFIHWITVICWVFFLRGWNLVLKL